MPYPTVTDDGTTVELDLHGARLAEAETLVRRCIELCSNRGRATLRIIHGLSSSEYDADQRTIKTIVHDVVEEHADSDIITGHYPFEGSITISFSVSARKDPTRITITNLT